MTTFLHDRRYWLLLAVCIASFLEPLATTVVTVSLPQIQRATGASFAELQWVLNAYVLTFAALVLTGGALADRFGRKRIFNVGLWMFITASLVCGIANDPLLLIVGRAVAGTGSAFMLSAGLALLVQVFHGKERVRAFAIWGVVVGAGSALGPLVGGLLTDNLGWRWIFFINLPVCLPLLWLSHWSAGESRDPQSGAIDWLGLGSFTGMFLLLMYALIEGNNLGWTSPALISLLVVSAALLAIFIRVQLRRPRPMFDLSLFANPTFTGASIVAIAIAAAFFTLLVYLPIYIQGVLGYSPSQTGLALVVMAVPLLVMGPVSARMAVVISPRLFLPFGLLIIAGGGFLLSLVDQYGATALYAGMIATGVGAGLINGELSNVAISVVAPERSGMASGINNTMRQLGFGIGIAGLGAIFSANLTHGLSQYDRAFVERVASGDVVAAASDIGSDPAGAVDTAMATLASAISDLSLWAAALAAAAAVLAFLLIRPVTVAKATREAG
ncbi:MFS transporter [Pseudaminobacter salicylatoxidans]|nr:MFS transporter [Pseudaminobacter salicylatoxidans]